MEPPNPSPPVAGAEEEGEPVQVGAQGIGVVGGVTNEGGQAFLKGRFLPARQPVGQRKMSISASSAASPISRVI
jgi:hypothetical protein